MTSRSLLACLSGHQDEITGVRLLDQIGNLIASSSKDGTVRVSHFFLFYFPFIFFLLFLFPI